MQHDNVRNLNTALLRETVIIFSPICFSEAKYVISSYNLMTDL